jgi:hypothetical protein
MCGQGRWAVSQSISHAVRPRIVLGVFWIAEREKHDSVPNARRLVTQSKKAILRGNGTRVRTTLNRTSPGRIVMLLENLIDYLSLINSRCRSIRISIRLCFAAEKPALASKRPFGPRYRKLRAIAGRQYRTPLPSSASKGRR